MAIKNEGRMLPGPSDEFIGETKSFLSCFVCWDVVYVPRNSNFFWLIILQSGLRSVHCKPGGFFSHLYSSSLGYLPGRRRKSRAILVLLMLFYCPSFLCNYILILTQPKKKLGNNAI